MRAGYIRVSTEEQEKGLSPEAQTNRLIAAGVAPDAITVETGSASKVKVPQLLALLERAKAGEITEITLRQDRLQRSHEIDFPMWQRSRSSAAPSRSWIKAVRLTLTIPSAAPARSSWALCRARDRDAVPACEERLGSTETS